MSLTVGASANQPILPKSQNKKPQEPAVTENVDSTSNNAQTEEEINKILEDLYSGVYTE